MTPRIKLSRSSGVPIFRQIFDQIAYMIEAGQLVDGDRLPSSRMLASNLQVNRNTVARAYAALRDRGLVESQRRNGMVVRGAGSVRDVAARHDEAQRVLHEAVSKCLELGLSAEDIASIAYHESLQAQHESLRLIFVECNIERAESFASQLSERLGMPVEPQVLGELTAEELHAADLVITTFFHLAEVRGLVRSGADGSTPPEVLAIVVAPHVKTLVRLAQIPKETRVGVLYATEDQGETMRRWLADTGLQHLVVLHSGSKEELEGIDLLVIPAENPELRHKAGDSVAIIEFPNVLDESSTRMAIDVLDELRARRRDALAASA